MAIQLPYFNGLVNSSAWTGPFPADTTGESADPPLVPHDYTVGPYGVFDNNQQTYTNGAYYSPTISYKQEITAVPGRLYVFELTIIKLSHDYGSSGSYLKPGLWDVYAAGADGAVPITGVLDTGNSYEPGSAGGSYNGYNWPLNTPITIRPYWIGGMSRIRPGTPVVFRPRIRMNRGINDFGIDNGNSASVYKIVGFKLAAEINIGVPSFPAIGRRGHPSFKPLNAPGLAEIGHKTLVINGPLAGVASTYFCSGSSPSTGTITSNPTTIQLTNAGPRTTFTWTPPSGMTVTNPTSLTTSFSQFLSLGQNVSGYASCYISDPDSGRSVTVDGILVNLRAQ